MRIVRHIVTGGLALLASVPAFADFCSGTPPFDDVPAGEVYCTNVEWLRNRGVTLGCGGNNYCPLDAVNRGAMALFMNRLGVALTTVSQSTSGYLIDPIDLDVDNIVCTSADIPITAYPRSITYHSTFSGLAPGALNYDHDLAYTLNAGASWNFLHAAVAKAGTAGAQWVSSSNEGVLDVFVGQTVRFGTIIRRTLGPGPASTLNFTQGRCFATLHMRNRNASVPPL